MSDRAVVSATFATLLVTWCWLPLVDRSRRLPAALAVSAVVTTLGLADLVHHRFFESVIAATELSAAAQLLNVPSSVLGLLESRDVIYFVEIGAIAMLLPVYYRLCRRTSPLDGRSTRVLACGLLVAALAAAIPAVQVVHRSWPFFRDPWVRRGIVDQIGLYGYHFLDAAQELERYVTRPPVTDADRALVASFLARSHTQAARRSPLFGVARGRNLILISAESLNAFPVGLEIGGQAVVPNLTALTRDSLWFTSFFEQVSLGETSDGEFLALESLYPLSDGAVAMRYATNDFRGLPAILADHGYATASAAAQDSETWNMREMHARHGFRRLFFDESFHADERIGNWIPDRQFFEQSIPYLESMPRPFMAFMLSASGHYPYRIPTKYRVLRLGPLEGTLLGDYLHAAHYFDGALGQFVERLRADGVLDESVLAVYGDHHGHLNDPAALARLLGFSASDAVAEWLSHKRVPFLIRLPRGEAAGPRAASGGHLDIAPTLLSLLGIRDDRAPMLGRDLTQDDDGLVVFRDGSFVAGQDVLLYPEGAASPSCYSLVRDQPIDCSALDASRREAEERLHVSDAIIYGNLVGATRSDAARSVSPP